MKIRFVSFLRRSLVLASALACVASSHADVPEAALVFNFDNQNSANYDDSQVFVQFAQGGSVFGGYYYNGTANVPLTLTQSGGTYFTQALSLADLNGQGLSVTNATSSLLYVSYGSALNITQGSPSPTATNNSNIGLRYQPFEFTFSPGTDSSGNLTGYGVGGGDLTSINVFSIPMQAVAVEDGNKKVGFNDGTTTTSIVNSLSAVVPSLAIMNSNITNNSGTFVRAIAPNSFGAGTTPYYSVPPSPNVYTASPQGGYGIGPFNPWQPALADLEANLAAGQIVALTGNTAYVASYANGTVNGTTNVFYSYYFTPNLTVQGDGNYSITFTGNVTATPGAVTGNATAPSGATYTNLTITMAPDRLLNVGNYNMELSAAVNQQVFTSANINGNNTSTGTTFSGSWSLVGDTQPPLQSNITTAMQQRVWGDFSEELLIGFLFNPNTQNITSADLFPANNDSPYYQYAYAGNLTSNQYNVFGKAIWDASNGTVYANPYDDRFGNNLLGIGTNITTAHWNLTLLPDNAVPEAADAALAVACGGLLGAVFFRRRSRK